MGQVVNLAERRRERQAGTVYVDLYDFTGLCIGEAVPISQVVLPHLLPSTLLSLKAVGFAYAGLCTIWPARRRKLDARHAHDGGAD